MSKDQVESQNGTRTKRAKWIKAAPGIRYKEHPTRKRNNRYFDRYYSIRYSVDGKVREEGLGWSSEGWDLEKVQEQLALLKRAARTGEGPVSLAEKRELAKAKREKEEDEKRKDLLFADAAKMFITQKKRLKRKDWQHDESRLNFHVLPVIGEKRISSISKLHVGDVRDACLDKGLSNATVRHCLTLIRSIFNFLEEKELFTGSNPAKMIIKNYGKEKNNREGYFTREQADILLETLKERSTDTHDMALLALYAGLRAGEIFSLTWERIDFKNKQAFILESHGGKTKNGETRLAHLSPPLLDMLERRKEYSTGKGLIFVRRDGGMYQDVSVTFYRTLRDLGFNEGKTNRLEKLSFHSLRHTFASWLANDGTPLYVIKDLMGHKTLEMTLRYAKLIPDQKNEAAEKLAESREMCEAVNDG